METSVIVGWALSITTLGQLFVSGILMAIKMPFFVNNFETLGIPPRLMLPFGLIKIMIAVLALTPHTSLLGVILATGWMGGAIASHVRVGDNFTVQTIIPILIWIGFGLRHQTEMRLLLGF